MSFIDFPAWLLVGLSTAAGGSADDAVIHQCPQPLVLHLRRLATANQPVRYLALDLCDAQESRELGEGSPAPGLKVQSEVASDGSLSLKFALGTSLRAEQRLGLDGREYPIAWRGGGPPVQVRAARVRDGLRWRIRVTDLPAGTLLQKLSGQGWQLEGQEALAAERVTLSFDQVAAHTVLTLVAGQAGLQVQQVGPGRYRIGTARNREAILALEARLPDSSAEREPVLRQIVELATAPDAPGLLIPPAAALQDLAEIATRREQYDAARSWWRQLLALLAQAEGVPEPEASSLALAEALGGLARVEVAAGQRAAARSLIDRALAIAEQRAGPYAAALPALLAQLSQLESDPSAAFTAIERAVLIAESNGAEPAELLPLLDQAAALHERTGAWADAAQLRQRVLDYERLTQVQDDTWRVGQRQLLATALEKSGRYQEASAAWKALLDSARTEYPRLRALRGLAELAIAGGAPEQARSSWEAVLASRQKTLGADHPRTRAAALEVAVITRLAAQVKGQADAGSAPPEPALRQLPVPATDPGLESLPLELRLEFGIDLLDQVHRRLSDDLEFAPAMPVLARAGRLEFRAELALALDGHGGLEAARRDYAAALVLRQKADPKGALARTSAARLQALEAQR